ncbi:DUF6916 family protein [Nocardioides donggukensis]|uniref:DUF6916 family protein n=1 Tax=Nocardioides donggukensis TaxID=2774019 RepID=UPI00384DD9F6
MAGIRIEPTYELFAALCGKHLHLVDEDQQPVLALYVASVVHEQASDRVTVRLTGPARQPLEAARRSLRTDGRDLWLTLVPVGRDETSLTYEATFDQGPSATASTGADAARVATSRPRGEGSPGTSASVTNPPLRYAIP